MNLLKNIKLNILTGKKTRLQAIALLASRTCLNCNYCTPKFHNCQRIFLRSKIVDRSTYWCRHWKEQDELTKRFFKDIEDMNEIKNLLSKAMGVPNEYIFGKKL
jgi:hypothetical protein